MILFVVGSARSGRTRAGAAATSACAGPAWRWRWTCVPEARLDDSVLVHAGVALSVLRGEDTEERSTCA